jgi:hypothetical protein
LVEQRIRNARVEGSSPPVGSISYEPIAEIHLRLFLETERDINHKTITRWDNFLIPAKKASMYFFGSIPRLCSFLASFRGVL